MPQARTHGPSGEPSLKDLVLLSGSDPGCLHSAAGEAPYCLDKLLNTESEGCPITHLPRCVCAVSAMFDPLQHVSEARGLLFYAKV